MTTTSVEATSKTASINGAGLHILIVDDNDDCAQSMAMLLRLYGHDVVIAPNGRIAVDKARADMPDVVLLDLGLPGMSGYEVAEQLCARRPRKTPLLVAVTGYGGEEDRRNSRKAGIDLHLLKPIDPNQLRAILETFQRVLSE